MSKFELIFKNDTIQVTFNEIQGYWLYDYTKSMNLAMRAKTERAAFIEAIEYYQELDKESKLRYNSLYDKVKSFIVQLDLEEFE